MADMIAFFARSLDIAARAGIARDKIVLDPGIGFGKTPEQSIACIARLAELKRFGLPLLVGASRKRFINAVTPAPPTERIGGSISAHLHGGRQRRGHRARARRRRDRAGAAGGRRHRGRAMSDRIFIHGLSLHAYHGVMAHEAKVGQTFTIDLELEIDLAAAARSRQGGRHRLLRQGGRLRDATPSAPQRYRLIEAAAGSVADAVLTAFPRVRFVRVTIHKPHAPIAATFSDVGVTLVRGRQDIKP